MSKKHSKIIVMLFIIVGSFLSLGLKFWADDAALDVDRPKIVKNGPFENLSFLIGNTIYTIDSDGLTSSVIDLKARGINIIGDFDFFSNNDMLLYNEEVESGFLESIAQFFRIKEFRQDKPVGKEGLYRCSYNVDNCTLFSTDLPAFHGAFRLFIDKQNDTVYIADTPRFKIYKLNSQGMLLAENSNGLLFPNQILLHDNSLYIANTNKHEIKVVDSSTENFGEKIKSYPVQLSDFHSWPAELIRIDRHWWVSVFGSNMGNGKIQVFDNKWNKIATPLLDEDADATSMALFQDTVFVNDWTKIKIYRYKFTGERSADFSNNDIDAVFFASNRAVKEYEQISFYGLLIFSVVFISGLIAAFVLEKEETLAVFKKNEYADVEVGDDLEYPPGDGVYWIESRYRKKLRWYGYGSVILLVLFSVPVLLFFFDDKEIDWLAFTLLFFYVPIWFSVIWLWYRLLIVRIGISGDMLLIDDGRSKVVAGKADRIKYNKNTVFIVNDAIAFLGQPRAPLFPKDELKRWVIPRMRQGEEVSHWYVQKFLWKQRHPAIIIPIILFIILLPILLIT